MRYDNETPISGPKVLSVLRQHRQKLKFDQLCVLLGVRGLTRQAELIQVLSRLHAQGLIIGNQPDFHGWDSDAIVQLSPSVPELAQVLGLSIQELTEHDMHKSLMVKPLFGRPVDLTNNDFTDLFVLMPFRKELTPIYENHIKRIAKKLNLAIKRGDDFFTSHDVMRDVWNGICNAKVVIADCTGRNPNVFYEIGIAHTVGKHVILITQNSEDVPFDIRHIRYIQYQYTPPGMKDFERVLERTIREIINKEI